VEARVDAPYVRSRFREASGRSPTLRTKGSVAPTPDLRARALERVGSTLSGHSCCPTASGAVVEGALAPIRPDIH
jgi:hypothetical protein